MGSGHQSNDATIPARTNHTALVASERTALYMQEDTVIISLDGRSAYDSISRAA